MSIHSRLPPRALHLAASAGLGLLAACTAPAGKGDKAARETADSADTADTTDTADTADSGDTVHTGDTGPLPDPDFSVTVTDTSLIQEGTTLFARVDDIKNQTIYEVDSRGVILWQWTLPEQEQVGFNVPEIMDVDVTPTGTLLVLVAFKGVYEINRDGDILSFIEDTDATHDADRVGEDHVLVVHGWADQGQMQVVELRASGEPEWSWNGMSWYNHEPYDAFANEGWMHPNAVSRLSDGDTLVTLRNFNTVARLNPGGDVQWEYTFQSTHEDVVQTEGTIPGERPHEGHLLSNLDLLVATRNPDRVVQVDLENDRLKWAWSFAGAKVPLDSIRGLIRLPNGNTLVTDTTRIIEINPWKGPVWILEIPLDDEAERTLYNCVRILPDGTVLDD